MMARPSSTEAALLIVSCVTEKHQFLCTVKPPEGVQKEHNP
uniref:Uncharacterized protein n=1 Tax=Arundo donax TaxID=35708 RepID=A0A0A9GWZ6_ARUDO